MAKKKRRPARKPKPVKNPESFVDDLEELDELDELAGEEQVTRALKAAVNSNLSQNLLTSTARRMDGNVSVILPYDDQRNLHKSTREEFVTRLHDDLRNSPLGGQAGWIGSIGWPEFDRRAERGNS